MSVQRSVGILICFPILYKTEIKVLLNWLIFKISYLKNFCGVFLVKILFFKKFVLNRWGETFWLVKNFIRALKKFKFRKNFTIFFSFLQGSLLLKIFIICSDLSQILTYYNLNYFMKGTRKVWNDWNWRKFHRVLRSL